MISKINRYIGIIIDNLDVDMDSLISFIAILTDEINGNALPDMKNIC